MSESTERQDVEPCPDTLRAIRAGAGRAVRVERRPGSGGEQPTSGRVSVTRSRA